MDLNEIVNQLELCEFTDRSGHKIENNIAFIELKGMVNGPKCKDCRWWLNDDEGCFNPHLDNGKVICFEQRTG